MHFCIYLFLIWTNEIYEKYITFQNCSQGVFNAFSFRYRSVLDIQQIIDDIIIICSCFHFVAPAEPAGFDRHPVGGGQSNPSRQHGSGESRGGSDLPASVENPQRLRPADRPGPAGLPTTGTLLMSTSLKTLKNEETNF